MRSKIILSQILLIGLIINCCVAEGVLNNNSVESVVFVGIVIPQKPHIVKNESHKTQMKFTDLIEDVQYLILDELGIRDLLNLAMTCSTFSSLASEVFHKKYKDYEISIWNAIDHGGIINESKIQNFIQILSFRNALNILKQFGSVIHQLELRNNNIAANKSATISQYINKYGSESITHLKLDFVKEDTFEQFTAPFANVVDLNFIIDKRIKRGVLPINVLFPSLQSLTLYLVADTDYGIICCEFQHLTHLHLLTQFGAWNRRDQIERLIKNNPQIQSIALEYFPGDFIMNFVNKHLPNLESLKINYFFDIGDDSAQFAQVKHFDLCDAAPGAIGKRLTFPNLQSVEIKYDPQDFDDWLEFFRRHRKIQRLNLIDPFQRRESTRLAVFTAQLEGLVEMKFECTEIVDPEEIVEFIEGHGGLMKFQFAAYDFRDIAILQERFENEWIISDIEMLAPSEWYSFERKNSERK